MKNLMVLIALIISCKSKESNNEVVSKNQTKEVLFNPNSSVEITELNEKKTKALFKEKQNILLPAWVRIILKKSQLELTEKERSSYCLLDITGDGIVEIIFILNDKLLLIQKNGNFLYLDNILDYEGDKLDDFSWVDYWYLNDNSELIEYDSDIEVKGQILELVKESSATVSIYFDGNNFKWLSYD